MPISRYTVTVCRHTVVRIGRLIAFAGSNVSAVTCCRNPFNLKVSYEILRLFL